MTGCCGKKLSVRVRFFAYFRDVFGGKERIVDLDAGTTLAGLLDLIGDSPDRRKELFADGAPASGPGLKPNLVVMINGADLASRGGLSAALHEGDTVAVFPLMGGG